MFYTGLVPVQPELAQDCLRPKTVFFIGGWGVHCMDNGLQLVLFTVNLILVVNITLRSSRQDYYLAENGLETRLENWLQQH